MSKLLAVAATLAALAGTAHANEPELTHQPGVMLGLGIGKAANSEETDGFGSATYGEVHAGFRFSTGTQLHAVGGFGIDGEDGVVIAGAAVRQHLRAGKAEPFLELGGYQIGADRDGPVRAGVGGGVDFRIHPAFAVGLAARGYFGGGDADVDWNAGVQLSLRLGIGPAPK